MESKNGVNRGYLVVLKGRKLRKGLDTVESLSAEASGNLLTNRYFYYCKVGPIFLVL